MNRLTRKGQAAHRVTVAMRARTPAPYVIVDDGRESRQPMIRLIRNCRTSDIAHVVRALSTQLAGELEPVAKCAVDLAGHRLANDLGSGVSVGAPS